MSTAQLSTPSSGIKAPFATRYGNFIGGKWVETVAGRYFDNVSPMTGKTICEIPRSDKDDVERALDAAHAAEAGLGTHKSGRTRQHPERDRPADGGQSRRLLAIAETWDNGKPIRETMAADLPLAIDHFRYFAGAIRAQEGGISRDRRRHGRLSLPRAARRRRPDHPVELPDPDGDVEAGAGAGRRQLRRAQAGRTDAGVDPGAGRS